MELLIKKAGVRVGVCGGQRLVRREGVVRAGLGDVGTLICCLGVNVEECSVAASRGQLPTCDTTVRNVRDMCIWTIELMDEQSLPKSCLSLRPPACATRDVGTALEQITGRD